MPQYRNPFEKGELVIVFDVKFPEDGFLDPEGIAKLEALLPPRTESIIPDDAEECELHRFDSKQHNRQRAQRQAYMEDDDDEMGGPRVQCASQ